MTTQSLRLKIFSVFLSTMLCSVTVLAQRAASLRGQVTDELGGVIVGATVSVTKSEGNTQTSVSNANGIYTLSNLESGTYTVVVNQVGFAPFQQANVTLVDAQPKVLNIVLKVATVQERVNVDPDATVGGDPSANKSAVVLKGNDLNALSDDPTELASELSALAGPMAGPNGAQVFVDGFTGAPNLPDKQSIREIVINQNPFSAEWERIGFGNIQIFTRPGTGKLHGAGAFSFSDDSFNSRNPYTTNRPDYQRRIYEFGLNGPVSKRASFFISGSRREIDDTAAINATALNDALQPVTISQAVVTPRRMNSIFSRFDIQQNTKNFLSGRYSLHSNDLTNQGIGGFSLESKGFKFSDRLHVLQLIETSLVTPTITNEAGFQFIWYNISQSSNDPGAGLIVLDSFNGGGAQIGQYSFDRDEGELRDYVTMSLGRHSLKFGARLRWAHISDIAPTNFGGTFTFSGGEAPLLNAANEVVPGRQIDINSLERYRRTLLFSQLGFTPSEIRAMGGGAAQLMIASGGEFAEVSQWDLAPFIQDDWKLRPNFTLSMGLRYQVQSNIKSDLLFAPRLSFAWTPFVKGNGQPRTVIRGGAGIFYDLIRTSITLQANRFNGSNQSQFIITDTALLDLFPSVPLPATLATLNQPQSIWLKETDLTQPYYIQSSISVERSLPRNLTLTLSYVNTRGLHQLRARNINAPIPGTALRPFPLNNNIYQYETGGTYRQQLFVVGGQMRLNPRFSFNANYTLGEANGDTDGPGSFPADSYNLTTEFGRASTDVRHRFTMSGNFETRWGLTFSPLVIAQSGSPFNIITGADDNNDSIFLDRPSFATDLNRPSVKVTSFGTFDIDPLPGSTLIPRNFAESGSYFSVNLRVQKTFLFGPLPRAAAPAPGQPQAQNRGATSSETRPYRFTIGLTLANIFNRNNPGPSIGNLTSPLFGVPNSLAQFTPLGGGGSASTSNRTVNLRAQFSF